MDLVDVWFFVTAWTEACQAPLSVEFSRQECWRGLPCPPPGDLHEPGIEPWVSCITGRLFTIWGTLDYLTGPSPRIPTNRMFHNWVKKGCDSRMWVGEKRCEKPLIHHDWLWRQKKGLWAKEGRCLLEAGRLKETFFQVPPEGAQPC